MENGARIVDPRTMQITVPNNRPQRPNNRETMITNTTPHHRVERTTTVPPPTNNNKMINPLEMQIIVPKSRRGKKQKRRSTHPNNNNYYHQQQQPPQSQATNTTAPEFNWYRPSTFINAMNTTTPLGGGGGIPPNTTEQATARIPGPGPLGPKLHAYYNTSFLPIAQETNPFVHATNNNRLTDKSSYNRLRPLVCGGTGQTGGGRRNLKGFAYHYDYYAKLLRCRKATYYKILLLAGFFIGFLTMVNLASRGLANSYTTQHRNTFNGGDQGGMTVEERDRQHHIVQRHNNVQYNKMNGNGREQREPGMTQMINPRMGNNNNQNQTPIYQQQFNNMQQPQQQQQQQGYNNPMNTNNNNNNKPNPIEGGNDYVTEEGAIIQSQPIPEVIPEALPPPPPPVEEVIIIPAVEIVEAPPPEGLEGSENIEPPQQQIMEDPEQILEPPIDQNNMEQPPQQIIEYPIDPNIEPTPPQQIMMEPPIDPNMEPPPLQQIIEPPLDTLALEEIPPVDLIPNEEEAHEQGKKKVYDIFDNFMGGLNGMFDQAPIEDISIEPEEKKIEKNSPGHSTTEETVRDIPIRGKKKKKPKIYDAFAAIGLEGLPKVERDGEVRLSELGNFKDITEPWDASDVPIFLHIPKAGGSTVKDIVGTCHRFIMASEKGILGGHGDDADIAIVYPGGGPAGQDRSPFVNVDTTTLDGIVRARDMDFADSGLADIVVTPFIFEVNDLMTPTAKGRLFTVFRHPIERAISMFYYIQIATWEVTYDPEVEFWSIEQYAKSSKVENNWLTRQLSNQPAGDLSDTNLIIAKNVIRQKFMVGLVSNIEATIDRLEKFFRWTYHVNPPNQEICRQALIDRGANSNVQSAKPKPEPGSEEWKMLEWQNKYDLELYAYIEVLFDEQEQIVSNLPDDFRNIDATCCKCGPATYPPEGFDCPMSFPN